MQFIPLPQSFTLHLLQGRHHPLVHHPDPPLIAVLTLLIPSPLSSRLIPGGLLRPHGSSLLSRQVGPPRHLFPQVREDFLVILIEIFIKHSSCRPHPEAFPRQVPPALLLQVLIALLWHSRHHRQPLLENSQPNRGPRARKLIPLTLRTLPQPPDHPLVRSPGLRSLCPRRSRPGPPLLHRLVRRLLIQPPRRLPPQVLIFQVITRPTSS